MHAYVQSIEYPSHVSIDVRLIHDFVNLFASQFVFDGLGNDGMIQRTTFAGCNDGFK